MRPRLLALATLLVMAPGCAERLNAGFPWLAGPWGGLGGVAEGRPLAFEEVGGCFVAEPRETYERIADAATWERRWQEVCGAAVPVPPPAPALDFGLVTVLGAFWGAKPTGGHGLEVTAVEHHGDLVVARVERARADPLTCAVTQAITHPGAFVAVERFDAPLSWDFEDHVVPCGPGPGPPREEPGPGQGPPEVHVEPAAFDRTGPYLVAATGCGFCVRDPGFRAPGQHQALLLHADGRAVRVDFNSEPSRSGFHVAEPITYDAGELQRALAGLRRAQGGVWVVGVWTGHVAGPDAERLREGLEAAWTRAGQAEPCADCGEVEYRLHARGEAAPRVQQVPLPLRPGDPFLAFQEPVLALLGELAERGAAQGAPAG